jgi:hypothetical protein
VTAPLGLARLLHPIEPREVSGWKLRRNRRDPWTRRALAPLRITKTGIGEPALNLQWSKRPDGGWWLFNDVELSQLDGLGVFVIWLNGSGVQVSAVLYVGRGDLKYEFARCRRDPLFRSTGLHVTWAQVNDIRELEGIAAYLYHQLSPMWGEAVPSVQPVAVNMPVSG